MYGNISSSVFATILSGRGSKNYCYNDIGAMRHGVGIHPVSLEDPIVATYLIQGNYNMPGAGYATVIFSCA